MKTSSQCKNNQTCKQKSVKRRLFVAATVVLFTPIILFLIALCGFEIWASGVKLEKEKLPALSSSPVFFDVDGNVIDSGSSPFIQKEDVTENLKFAFVAVEDKRFFKHKGVDVVRIAGAMAKNIKAGGIKEGASTITQQLVKNTMLTQKRTYKRKLKEIALAKKLEKSYSKDEILAMYLSVVYFGSGAYGVREAAERFFSKSVAKLSLAECATLAGLVRNPAGYSPIRHKNECVARRNTVLDLMHEQGYISKEECETAKNSPLEVSETSSHTKDFELYVNLAKDEVMRALDMTRAEFENSNLKIHTFLDMRVQNALKKFVNTSENRSSIVIENAGGKVVAYSSSLPYEALRQPGSALKPLAVYSPAFDLGLVSPATHIVDEKVDVASYSPKNFNDKYYGETNVREAIMRSMNSVSVKVMNFVGVEKSAEYLENFGINISEEDKNLSLSLGAMTEGVSASAIAAAYATLANLGKYTPARFVNFCESNGRKISFSDIYSIKITRAIKRSSASLMTSALLDCVKGGTAKALSSLNFQVAAKTGTAERADGKNSDAWCASYNQTHTVVVWHGSDVGFDEKGGGKPASECADIWRELEKLVDMPKTVPLFDVVEVEIDEYSSKVKQKIIKATPLTPAKYKKTELFSCDSVPSEDDSSFFGGDDCEFEIKVKDGYVQISFLQEEIFKYRLLRRDILGERVIYDSTGNEKATLQDAPTSLGGRVEYVLTIYLEDNVPLRTETKTIFYDMMGL